MSVEVSRYQDVLAVVLRGRGLRATVLPAPGGKLISLVDELTGHDFIWQDPHRRVGRLEPGAGYAESDISGIDDCFPSIDPCQYPVPPFAGTPIADHGDVWARDWTWRIDEDAVILSVRGTSLPYLLEKRLTVGGNGLCASYRLRGDADTALVYQWTGHPLLRVDADSRLVLGGSPSGRVAFATGGRLAPAASGWRWPHVPAAAGGLVDLSRALPSTAGVNEKVWLAVPAIQQCQLTYPGSGHRLTLMFDPDQLPWLAICVNYGGWPAGAPRSWVALEPSTSGQDALTGSWQAGTARTLPPGAEHTWWWTLNPSIDAKPNAAATW